MAMEIAQQQAQLATPVARRTTGQLYAEALGEGTVRQDVPPLRAGHSNKGKGDHSGKQFFKKGKGGPGKQQSGSKKQGTPNKPFKPWTHKQPIP